MSVAAKKLSSAQPSGSRIRRGPTNLCGPIYEPDLEDAEAIQEFRRRPGESWATAQAMFDKLAGVKVRIPNDKFRYHWRRKCFCWPDDLRLP
jgi:tRNA G26 N,N-dimethylase Trm1